MKGTKISIKKINIYFIPDECEKHKSKKEEISWKEKSFNSSQFFLAFFLSLHFASYICVSLCLSYE
jgi:hypothetical protein